MKTYELRSTSFGVTTNGNASASRLASRGSIFGMSRLTALGLFAALVIGAPLLHAQRGGGMSGGAPGGMGLAAGAPAPQAGGGMGVPHGVPPGTIPNGTGGHPRPGIVGGFGHHHGGFRNNNRAFGNNVFLGAPYWGGPLWDDGEEVVYEQPPAQQAQGAPVVQQRVVEPSRPPAEPLMIEWQGDHYVRSGGQIAGNNHANNVVAQRDYSEAPRSGAKSNTQSLPPAVLAFRNGTRHEVNSYMIVGKTLYASGNYWTQGYWNKTIQLADLDLPETIRLNQQRGVEFKLPTAPNDIVTRP